jgi:hypothetical protein
MVWEMKWLVENAFGDQKMLSNQVNSLFKVGKEEKLPQS